MKAGERVKIITENGSDVYEISAVENNRFQVAIEGPSLLSGQVFVYGREVDDFHTVDYEALSMLNVSATQEQQRVIEQQQAEIEKLKKQNIELKASFEARLEALEGVFRQKSSYQNQ